MGIAKTNPRVQKQPGEDETFWHQHIATQISSGLSKLAYCQAYQVDYSRFIYWSKKATTSSVKPLIAVKLSSGEERGHSMALCTVLLKSGCSLHVHDVRALPVIIEELN